MHQYNNDDYKSLDNPNPNPSSRFMGTEEESATKVRDTINTIYGCGSQAEADQRFQEFISNYNYRLYFTIRHTKVKFYIDSAKALRTVMISRINGNFSLMQLLAPLNDSDSAPSVASEKRKTDTKVIPTIPNEVSQEIDNIRRENASATNGIICQREADIALTLVCRLSILEAWRRLGHKHDDAFKREIESLDKIKATIAHVTTEGWLKTWAPFAYFVFTKVFWENKLNQNNLDSPVAYADSWYEYLAYWVGGVGIIASGLSWANVTMQFNFARSNLGPLTKRLFQPGYWHPDVIIKFLAKNFKIDNIHFENGLTYSSDQTTSRSAHDPNEKALANRTALAAWLIWITENLDAITAVSVFGINYIISNPEKYDHWIDTFLKRVSVSASLFAIGLLPGSVKAMSNTAAAQKIALLVKYGELRFQEGVIPHLPEEHSSLIHWVLSKYRFLSWSIPGLFLFLHEAGIFAASTVNQNIRIFLALNAAIGVMKKARRYDTELFLRSLGLSTEQIKAPYGENPTCCGAFGNWLAQMLGADWFKIDTKLFGIDIKEKTGLDFSKLKLYYGTFSYAIGFTFLAFAVFKSFLIRVILPPFTETDEIFKPRFSVGEWLGDFASYGGLALLYPAWRAAKPQTLQCYDVLLAERAEHLKPASIQEIDATPDLMAKEIEDPNENPEYTYNGIGLPEDPLYTQLGM